MQHPAQHFLEVDQGPLPAIGVACDALLVRMTAVPAVLALAGRKAWYLPKWLDRILPNLDVEGASLRERPSTPQPQVREPAC